jgi:hypothetical protein
MNRAVLAGRLDLFDKLIAYFFDHPGLDPFLPSAFKQIPGLLDRLLQEKAVLSIQSLDSTPAMESSSEPVQFSLFYTALYHSGAILNREALVKQRVIEYRNRERSLS